MVDSQTPHFDVIITNPPMATKREFIKKCILYGKPFLLLLPFDTISSSWFTKDIINADITLDLVIIQGNSRFILGEKIKSMGICAWFCFRIPNSRGGTYEVVPQGNKGDVDLDEESVGADYDPDEFEAQQEEELLTGDPNTVFTEEGYVQDGFVVGQTIKDA